MSNDDKLQSKPDGYAVLLDDKASAPNGFWFINTYHDQGIAADVAQKQKGARVVPIFFAESIELAPQEKAAVPAGQAPLEQRAGPAALSATPASDKREKAGALNTDLTRWIDKMHDAIINTEASGRPVGNLFQLWWGLKTEIEKALEQSATRPLLPHGLLKLLTDIESNAAIGEPSWDDIEQRIRSAKEHLSHPYVGEKR